MVDEQRADSGPSQRAPRGGARTTGDRPRRATVLVGPTDFDAFCEREFPSMARALALALDDRELGRDAAAEGFTRAWERWQQVADMSNPAGWVYRVGLNWARSRLRKRRREVVTALVPERASTSTSPSEHDEQLAAALAALPDHQRAVVVARFYLDWSEADIAAGLDIPVGTVKSRLSRALTQLDQRLRGSS